MTPRSLPARIVLASQSPRRRDLLSLIGIPHTVRPADIDESIAPGEAPLAAVERLARTKAEHIVQLTAGSGEDPPLIIAADTIVVIDDVVLNKPRDVSDARAMLTRLRGRMHDVHTGVCVRWGERRATGIESARVRFRSLTDEEVDAYIATGEPMDKAGAYGIQGYGATIVERVDGDYFSVMGLGLRRLVELLGRVGAAYSFVEKGGGGEYKSEG